MLNFPNIKNPIYPLKHKRVDHTYKMEQDNETINTRPRFTKSRCILLCSGQLCLRPIIPCLTHF